MISATFAKGWFKGENNSANYEYFPFFIRRMSYVYEKELYGRVIEAIIRLKSKKLSADAWKKMFSSAFDARLEFLFLSGYFNYWSPKNPHQRETVRFIMDYLYAVNPSDPLGASGSYLPKPAGEVAGIAKMEGFEGKKVKEFIGKLVVAMKAAAWATTSETIYMAKSIEGPYFLGSLNKFAFIRSYFSLKNPEIWPHSAGYRFDRIDVCAFYERGKSNFGKIDIDFYGNYSAGFNLNNMEKAIVLLDGKPIKSLKEMEEATSHLEKISLEQTKHFRNLPLKEQMKRVMELHYKVYRNVFALAGMDWRPSDAAYALVESKELKPKEEKNDVYEENSDYDEFTALTLKMIDDANYDGKYSRLCEKLNALALDSPSGIEFYGGKAVNLGALSRRGFNVPAGAVLTTEAFKSFMSVNNFYSKIKGILNDIDTKDTASVNSASSKISRLILSGSIDRETQDAVKKMCYFRGKVSVRSSATAEDLAEASFAGQMDSFLNVETEDIIQSIKKCWASLYSARAIEYRAMKGFSLYNTAMAVIIQEMIDAEMAGVSFTSDPISGSNNIMIEAAQGLGDNVVSGKARPDRIILSRELVAVKYEQGNSERLISDKLAKEIAEQSMKIEALFGVPLDVEWAFHKGGLFILQARPMTALHKAKHLHKLPATDYGKEILRGIPASEGVAKGRVCIIRELRDLEKFKEGDILAASATRPDFVIVMSKAAGIITEHGGIASHAAIVSRELGIPCIVGCKGLLSRLKGGEKIVLDGDGGVIYEG